MCRSELERAGFSCKELPVEYSQWPGKWGSPLAATFQAATVIVVVRTFVANGVLAAVLAGAVLLTILFFINADAKRRWIEVLRFQRAHSANLEASRGNPAVWLIAPAVIAAIPSMFCFVRNDSAGAVDNASGVVAVLLAARSASAPRDVGVLVTSGEELGLAGARVWARHAERSITVLNCDTIDDAGDWRSMYTGSRPKRIAPAVEGVASRLRVPLAMRRLIPGILADSMAFADRGIEAITLSRGTLSTLARIHTRRDNSNALTGQGAAEASVILSALAKELS